MDTNTARQHIAFALDVPELHSAEKLVKALSPYVGYLKIGLELYLSHGPRVVEWARANAPDCRIFLDLKLHDVPETVRRAARAVSSLGADLLTVHACDGEEIIQAAVEGAPQTKVVAITVLTSLPREQSTEALVLARAESAQRAGAAGVVCSGEEVAALRARLGAAFRLITPGIRPAGTAPGDQKRIATPRDALWAGADLLVIGRPLRDAPDPAQAARALLEEVATAQRDLSPSKN